jgi:uncharacterized protein YoxC
VSIGIILRKCLLILWRFEVDDGMLPRVLQLAQSLQLPLLLRSIIPSSKRENLADCLSLLQTAYTSLHSVYGDNSERIGTVSFSEVALQQFRNTLASLSRALNVVTQPVAAFDDNVGVTVAAVAELLIKDNVFDDAETFLGRLLTGMREDMTQATKSVNRSGGVDECAATSTAALCLALDSEKNARAAADVKASWLQRECQNLKDELTRAIESAAAASCRSESQLQLMTSQMNVLQVIIYHSASSLCLKADTVISQAANDALLQDVQSKVFKIDILMHKTL